MDETARYSNIKKKAHQSSAMGIKFCFIKNVFLTVYGIVR